jgi:hypothetical protein
VAIRTPIRTNEVLNPNKILGNIIRDYIGNRLTDSNFLYRVLVTKVDLVGRKIRRSRHRNKKR